LISQLHAAPAALSGAPLLFEMELRLLCRPLHSLGTIMTELPAFTVVIYAALCITDRLQPIRK